MSDPNPKIDEQRLKNLKGLEAAGIPTYPDRFERSHRLHEGASMAEGLPLSVSGRIMAVRTMGKISFIRLQDFDGSLQAVIQVDHVGEDVFHTLVQKLLDIGDFIGVIGKSYKTRRGEPSIQAEKIVFLGKGLRSLPEKFHGLNDQETVYRQRYLDLVSNAASRERFTRRFAIMRFIRSFLEGHNFIEVETPILNNHLSGATAQPFTTKHQALDLDLFLRVAPETWLKRCIVAGFDRVFEYARCFRNEGMDPSHLQEFTLLEFYAAYWNHEDLINFTEDLFQKLVPAICGTSIVSLGGRDIDFSSPFPRKTFAELMESYTGLCVKNYTDPKELRAAVSSETTCLLEEHEAQSLGSIWDTVYKRLVRPHLDGPIFVTNHPIDLSPLARRSDHVDNEADRFQLVLASWEVVNAYSELANPIDQRSRFQEQARRRASGDPEAMSMDDDFVEALEYGMPPVAGFGLGIDRLCALLSGVSNLRDVVLFPLMRPRAPMQEGLQTES